MTHSRYNLSNVNKAIQNPSLFLEEMERLSKPKNINKILNKILFEKDYGDQANVMAEDWDNLIILDGFRYDYFEQYNTIDGELSRITSQGSHSTEFLEKTFVGRQFHDTVYITANPHAPRLVDDDVFYLMESVYDADRETAAREHYPEQVIEMALPVIEGYPNKRHIIHMMQPNVPFLGPTAEKIRERLYSEEGVTFVNMEPSDVPESFSPREELGTIKEACEKGYISEVSLREAYRENVKIALEYAQQLLDEIEGKTAITADHGEMLGERVPPLYYKQYSHERHIYTDELRHVPWLVIDSDERREIYSEDPLQDSQLADDTVKDRLEKLGYLDYV
ncbi:hypothetical protein SAMN04488063_1662 [Halopelagius inordinatus]|uniref:Sulfatase n=1 Tax=Halopelagius inordinatus TaxID=553467 RepID=A0A1I2PV88_9EURY|nr:hypothetical protein [Halopelagius inordinatus]SFG17526.1 hypothetical protein SAMN04488063_1662 [Halopelagius inordinatus]